MPDAKFQFYEVVCVVSDKPELTEIQGQCGTILGRSADDAGHVGYAVFIDSAGECWSVDEHDLQSTGTVLSRSDFYDDSQVVRVQVDTQGRGFLVD